MNPKKYSRLVGLALLGLFVTAPSTRAQTPPAAAGPATAPAPDAAPGPNPAPELLVARSGTEVFLGIILPQEAFTGIDIMRNTQKDAKGRTRVSAISKVRTYIDKVPDATVTYWYWVKATRADGTTFNLGPVPTPSGEVWTPSP